MNGVFAGIASDLHDSPTDLLNAESGLSLGELKFLFITGDVCCIRRVFDGDLSHYKLLETQEIQLIKANQVLIEAQKLNPNLKVIFTPGNHDPEDEELLRRSLTAAEVLIDSGAEINVDGRNFLVWGTPWIPVWGGVSDVKQHITHQCIEGATIAEHFSKIPPETAILLSHSPPLGRRDVRGGKSSGSRALRNVVDTLHELAFHAYGHIHEGYGVSQLFQSNPYPGHQEGPYHEFLSVNASLQKIDDPNSYHPRIDVSLTTLERLDRTILRASQIK